MKLIKTIIAATALATGLFGLQAFAHGGGGGGAGHAGGGGFTGGAMGRPSLGFAPGAGGGMNGGAIGGNHAAVGQARLGRFGGFGRGLFGYGWGGYGGGLGVYGGSWGYPSSGYYGASEPQAVDTSAQDYERERDRKRLALPDSAFVKNYGGANRR